MFYFPPPSLMYFPQGTIFPFPLVTTARPTRKRTGRIAVIQQPCDGVTYEYISKWPSVRWFEKGVGGARGWGGPSRLRERGSIQHPPRTLYTSRRTFTLWTFSAARFPIQDSGAEVRDPRETQFLESLTNHHWLSFIWPGVAGSGD